MNRRDEIEAWWALIARVLAFFLGGAMLSWQQFIETEPRLYLTIAACGLMGPAVAQAVAQIVHAFDRGGSG